MNGETVRLRMDMPLKLWLH